MFARERRELTGDVSALLDREAAEQLDAWRRWIADLLAGGGFRTVLLVGLFGCILLSCLVFTVFKCCKVRFTQFKFFVFLRMYRNVRISSYCSEDKFINRLNKLFRAPCTPFLIRKKKNMLY